MGAGVIRDRFAAYFLPGLIAVAAGAVSAAPGYAQRASGMDTSIVIRTYAIRSGRVTFQAGGGIVADSTPREEYAETLAKARALITALSPGGGS